LGDEADQYDDAFYYRFLRARRYNMKDSTKMLLGFVVRKYFLFNFRT